MSTSLCLSQKSQTIPIEGGKLHYTTYGKGDPILIINGGPGFNSNGFQPLAKKLAEMGYMAILFDQRGTGGSTLDIADETTITMDLMVKDIETLRQHHSIKDWIIFGHSFGGMLGSYYVSKYPDPVKGIILSSSGGLDLSLLNSAGTNFTQHLTPTERDSLDYYRTKRNQFPNDESISKIYYKLFAKAYVKDEAHVSTVAMRLAQSDMRINRIVWSNLNAINFDVKNMLKSFVRPVLILHGDEDIVSIEVASVAQHTFQNSKLVILNNSLHYGWLDAPNVYFSEIEQFLEILP
ncbi:alpha/beta fold hydrolase [Aegicerativicinus sediminis]|uniref:alpha/beta fold hydrolase n=1 Tax=Aegicerativicinus sediminis TaxID=2893202 RepID=UPI001E40D040|nr:alpha/beta hydrolase [Aegicerativicinus sediminis]